MADISNDAEERPGIVRVFGEPETFTVANKSSQAGQGR
jgi:hypothetical protein